MAKLIIVEQKTLEKNDKAALKRIAKENVGYMELSAIAKGFACGNCRSPDRESFCQNPKVQAYISLNHGCCNYFYPDRAEELTFPKEK